MEHIMELTPLNSAAPHTQKPEKFAATAEEFEAVFIAEMMKPMFEGLKTEGMFGGGKAEEIFRGMILQEYGKMMAGTGALNMADSVKAEMIKMQEHAQEQTQ